ncbi:hypothetical protein GCM10017783_20480 [Deinococcus piscis]|uniref:DUF2834 domain-containing protein n=1 Tax=Deinococcus piscis TaxID=394230 RepID=A0ABQ3KCR5_9DEIO|nr:DUF2834 domain-containing protein [Deinococcus piscis]GHG07803.1 hypothetical protein GCM10017783_20480 [Deinococcus piscis]
MTHEAKLYAYLALAALGLLLPLSQFVPWLLEHGLHLGLLWDEIIQSRISAFAWADVAVTALSVVVLLAAETHRKVPYRWLAALGTLLVGPSFGLPLYLFLRELGKRELA